MISVCNLLTHLANPARADNQDSTMNQVWSSSGPACFKILSFLNNFLTVLKSSIYPAISSFKDPNILCFVSKYFYRSVILKKL